jgi:hypothetical protein
MVHKCNPRRLRKIDAAHRRDPDEPEYDPDLVPDQSTDERLKDGFAMLDLTEKD